MPESEKRDRKEGLFLPERWVFMPICVGVGESSLSSGVFSQDRMYGYSRLNFLHGFPPGNIKPDRRLDGQHPGYSPRMVQFLHKPAPRCADGWCAFSIDRMEERDTTLRSNPCLTWFTEGYPVAIRSFSFYIRREQRIMRRVVLPLSHLSGL